MKYTWLMMGWLVAPLVLAQSPPAASEPARPVAQAADESQQAPPLSDRHCLRQTGSRISSNRERSPARNAQDASENRAACAPVSGRAYTREDIDRTGAFDLAEALRRLDPAVH